MLNMVKMAKLAELDNKFIEFFSQTGDYHKFDNMTSKIFATLYLEPAEITMEELSEKTGYSIASIHHAVKSIEGTGFLNINKKPGTKKLYFFIDKDISRHIRNMFEKMNEYKIKPSKEFLPKLISEYKQQVKSGDAYAGKKLGILENYYKHILKSEKIINMMIKEI